MAWKAVGDAMQDVADDGAGRRSDDADDLRQVGDELLARIVEQAFGRELAAAFLEQGHESADARRLHRFDDDLVGGLALEGGQLAGGDDLEPFLGLDAHAAVGALPDDRIDLGALVLQGKIAVAGRMRAAPAGHLAAHLHIAEAVLDGALQRIRKLADGDFGGIAGSGVGHGGRLADPC